MLQYLKYFVVFVFLLASADVEAQENIKVECFTQTTTIDYANFNANVDGYIMYNSKGRVCVYESAGLNRITIVGENI